MGISIKHFLQSGSRLSVAGAGSSSRIMQGGGIPRAAALGSWGDFPFSGDL
jgi:hypothetical protein